MSRKYLNRGEGLLKSTINIAQFVPESLYVIVWALLTGVIKGGKFHG